MELTTKGGYVKSKKMWVIKFKERLIFGGKNVFSFLKKSKFLRKKNSILFYIKILNYFNSENIIKLWNILRKGVMSILKKCGLYIKFKEGLIFGSKKFFFFKKTRSLRKKNLILFSIKILNYFNSENIIKSWNLLRLKA